MINLKHGDTLVEVTIAIGIFSMIAIAVASVMSSGVSSSQTALETTLAREEIDAQADALRFLQSSYVSSKRFEDVKNDYQDSTNPNRAIWGQIVDRVNSVETINPSDETPSVEQFSPADCDSLYNKDFEDSLYAQKAFILDLKNLSDSTKAVIASDPNNAGDGSPFATAQTYPRVAFSNKENDQNLITITGTGSSLYKAYGIYIVGVQDPKTTNISGNTNTSAYYDFYIRTCWYGTNANRPSTISTVVRLYNPDVK